MQTFTLDIAVCDWAKDFWVSNTKATECDCLSLVLSVYSSSP